MKLIILNMRTTILTLIAFVFIPFTGWAQKKWNLKSIVEYAMANNLSVKQTSLQSENAAINYKQSKLSQYPNANFSMSGSVNSGSNQDPTTFNRITETYLSSGLQLQSSADIFNFYSKKNTIAANSWELMAAKANIAKVSNDIALSAANAYLQVLLAMEQTKITAVQLQQSQAQLNTIRKQVNAGALPELNASQLEAQVASDSFNYISAKAGVEQNIFNLKALMNIDAAAPFEVETPPVEQIPVEAIADLQPENVYQQALTNQPQQQYNEFKLKAAQKSAASSKASMYPTLSAFGSLGSGYNNRYQTLTGVNSIVGPDKPIGTVTVSGNPYTVYAPSIVNTPIYSKSGFGSQLSDNFRQSIGLSVSVPIFSGGSLRSNYERSKVNIRSLQVQKEADNQKLKQDIYTAYNAAVVALEKYNASKKTVEANEKALGFAQKRFEVGMLGTYDYLTTQNNLLKAKLEFALNRFDYVFKMKVLEFYKGLGLKL